MSQGYTLADLLVTLAVIASVAAMSVPRVDAALDVWRTRGAAFFLAGRFGLARMQAVHRGANVAVRFTPQGAAFAMRTYVDGNDNGVRAADITRDLDRPLGDADRLDHLFPGVRYGFIPGATLIDGTTVPVDGDPVRFGSSDMLSFSPAGTATAGTAYLRGRGRVQFAVVVLGATGRTRVLRFDADTARWVVP